MLAARLVSPLLSGVSDPIVILAIALGIAGVAILILFARDKI